MLLSGLAAHAQQPGEIDREREYNVKAANLYGLGLHTEWPVAEDGPAKAFRIAVLGDDPFQGKMERVAQSKKSLQNLPLIIDHPRSMEDIRGCQMVFIPSSVDPSSLPAILAQARNRPTLVIGESPRFIESGGDANLVVDGGKIRLELNAKALSQKKIRPSAQLLKIATIVPDPSEVSQRSGQ